MKHIIIMLPNFTKLYYIFLFFKMALISKCCFYLFDYESLGFHTTAVT